MKKKIKGFYERRIKLREGKGSFEKVSNEENMELLFECVDDIIKHLNAPSTKKVNSK